MMMMIIIIIIIKDRLKVSCGTLDGPSGRISVENKT